MCARMIHAIATRSFAMNVSYETEENPASVIKLAVSVAQEQPSLKYFHNPSKDFCNFLLKLPSSSENKRKR